MSSVTIKVQRGNEDDGYTMETYTVDVEPGMVVLDAIHLAQAQYAHDLAVRWNCKAGKCGSCAGEVNGKPRLMCMTKLSEYKEGEVIEIRPLKTFPTIKDLVPDVSWNFEVNKKIKKYKHPEFGSKLVDPETGEGIMYQYQVERAQEYRKCIECFLCQNVCHVLRTHDKKQEFGGPRFLSRLASLQFHPLDQESDRLETAKDVLGVGFCNITRCCTEVCPESIKITDNAIIPLKENVANKFYNPAATVIRFFKTLGSKSD